MCILSFPKAPNLDLSLPNLETKRVRSRIDEDCMFLVRMEKTSGGKIDKVYPLPPKPSECPEWKYAITAPAIIGEERGLLFALKERGLFWEIEKEKSSNWAKLKNKINKDFILASMEVDPTPHKLFCQEILHAEHMERLCKTPQLKTNPWPESWHIEWLKLLLNTSVREENDQAISNEDQTELKFPLDLESTKGLLKKLKRGTIVSMALRSCKELSQAYELINKVCLNKPKDNNWKSLLEIF
jgi:hypothetical protein